MCVMEEVPSIPLTVLHHSLPQAGLRPSRHLPHPGKYHRRLDGCRFVSPLSKRNQSPSCGNMLWRQFVLWSSKGPSKHISIAWTQKQTQTCLELDQLSAMFRFCRQIGCCQWETVTWNEREKLLQVLNIYHRNSAGKWVDIILTADHHSPQQAEHHKCQFVRASRLSCFPSGTQFGRFRKAKSGRTENEMKTLANLTPCGVHFFMRLAANSSIFNVGGLFCEVDSEGVDCEVLENSDLTLADTSTSDNGTRGVFRKENCTRRSFQITHGEGGAGGSDDKISSSRAFWAASSSSGACVSFLEIGRSSLLYQAWLSHAQSKIVNFGFAWSWLTWMPCWFLQM